MSPRLRYLATTLALVAVGLGYALIQAKPWRPAPRLQARPAEAVHPPAPPLPTARQMLDRRADLSLTADQKARLSTLDEKWRKDSASLEVALKTAEQDFSQYVKVAQAEGKANLQEIQRRSADYRALSAELREARRRHAEAAAQVLSQSQQRRLALLTSPQTPGGVQ